MRKQKMLALILCAVMACATATATGCGEKPGPSDGPSNSDSPSKTEVSLNASTLALEKYADYALTATVSDSSEVTWTSSNPAVVTVENGFVVALAAGTATITATAGGTSATCEVTVTEGNVPVLQSADSEVQLFPEMTYEYAAKVVFAGKQYDPESLTLTAKDDKVVTVSGNVITAVGVGETEIAVTATWRGAPSEQLSATVKVRVVENVVFSFKDADGQEVENFSVYTVNKVDGTDFENSVTPTASVKVNDKAVDSAITYKVVEGADLVSCEGGTITALGKAGTAKVQAVVSVDGKEYHSQTLTVSVERPVVKAEISAVADLHTQRLQNGFNVFTDGKSITEIADITDGEPKDLAYDAKGETNFSKEGTQAGARKWVVYNESYGYEISVDVKEQFASTLHFAGTGWGGATLVGFKISETLAYTGGATVEASIWSGSVLVNGVADANAKIATAGGVIYVTGNYKKGDTVTLKAGTIFTWKDKSEFNNEDKYYMFDKDYSQQMVDTDMGTDSGDWAIPLQITGACWGNKNNVGFVLDQEVNASHPDGGSATTTILVGTPLWNDEANESAQIQYNVAAGIGPMFFLTGNYSLGDIVVVEAGTVITWKWGFDDQNHYVIANTFAQQMVEAGTGEKEGDWIVYDLA